MTHGADKPASVETPPSASPVAVATKPNPKGPPKPSKHGAIHVPAPAQPGKEQGEGVKYLAGTRLDCPVQNVHVKGICFHRFTGGAPVFVERGKGAGQPGVHVNDARELGAKRWGGFVHLTDDHLAALCEDVARKFLRKQGAHYKVITTLAPSYKPMATDDPLGRYIYLVRADKLSADHMETGDYPPMIAE